MTRRLSARTARSVTLAAVAALALTTATLSPAAKAAPTAVPTTQPATSTIVVDAVPSTQPATSSTVVDAVPLTYFGIGVLPHDRNSIVWPGWPSRSGNSQSGNSQSGGSSSQSGDSPSGGSSSPSGTNPWGGSPSGGAGGNGTGSGSADSPAGGSTSPSGGWGRSCSGSTPAWWCGNGPSGSAPTSNAANPASAQDSAGVVLINTTLGWGTGEAAGTGLVLDSAGVVVTNHHVVANSTEVTVTVPATHQTYTADVLGYDSTADVAVLRLEDASGLATVTTDTTTVQPGASVTAVGNARGGGQLLASAGQVTDTGANITVANDSTGGSSPLTDLIATDAPMVPGDSGGALREADGDVVGLNVAGSADQRQSVGYAIPIGTVLDVAQQVLAGQASDTVTLGRTGGLGVTVSPRPMSGVGVVGVVTNGPADQAGVTAGSVLTAVDGTPVTDQASLAATLRAHAPGDRVTLTWTDGSGASQTATVTLGTAPLA